MFLRLCRPIMIMNRNNKKGKLPHDEKKRKVLSISHFSGAYKSLTDIEKIKAVVMEGSVCSDFKCIY